MRALSGRGRRKPTHHAPRQRDCDTFQGDCFERVRDRTTIADRCGTKRCPYRAYSGFPRFRFPSRRVSQMPTNSRFRLPIGEIEVSPRRGLRAAIPGALRRLGPLTSVQAADWLYWARRPRDHRMAARWRANRSQRSATRRALARLKRDGAVVITGRAVRFFLYAARQREDARL
jgi:hypothetical protein